MTSTSSTLSSSSFSAPAAVSPSEPDFSKLRVRMFPILIGIVPIPNGTSTGMMPVSLALPRFKDGKPVCSIEMVGVGDTFADRDPVVALESVWSLTEVADLAHGEEESAPVEVTYDQRKLGMGSAALPIAPGQTLMFPLPAGALPHQCAVARNGYSNKDLADKLEFYFTPGMYLINPDDSLSSEFQPALMEIEDAVMANLPPSAEGVKDAASAGKDLTRTRRVVTRSNVRLGVKLSWPGAEDIVLNGIKSFLEDECEADHLKTLMDNNGVEEMACDAGVSVQTVHKMFVQALEKHGVKVPAADFPKADLSGFSLSGVNPINVVPASSSALN
jgi:hypothetical protein